jgi:hypothetical protein
MKHLLKIAEGNLISPSYHTDTLHPEKENEKVHANSHEDGYSTH